MSTSLNPERSNYTLRCSRALPPFDVCSNTVLGTLARQRPTDAEELKRVPGLVDHKRATYGAAILDLLQRGLRTHAAAFGDGGCGGGVSPGPGDSAIVAPVSVPGPDVPVLARAPAQLARTTSYPANSTAYKEILRLYSSGESVTAIRRQLSISESSILAHLADAAEEGVALNAASAGVSADDCLAIVATARKLGIYGPRLDSRNLVHLGPRLNGHSPSLFRLVVAVHWYHDPSSVPPC